jgi:hypothetical protein
LKGRKFVYIANSLPPSRRYKLKRSLLVLISIAVIIFAYIRINDKQKDMEIITSGNSSDNRVGFILGLTSDNNLSPINFTHLVSNGDSYVAEVYIYNKFPIKNMYRLFFVLDYKQTEVFLKNEKINYLDITLDPYSEKRFTIKMPAIKSGLHDFIIWGVRNPNDNLVKKEFVPPTLLNIHRRVTLISGSNDDPIAPNVDYLEKPTVPSSGKPLPLLITEQPRNTIQGEVATIINKNTTIWLNFSTQKPNMSYAIIAFLGTNQIKLATPFIKTNSEGVVQYPLEIDTEKADNLSIAVVENPFLLIETVPGKLKNEPWSIQFGNKITVE